MKLHFSLSFLLPSLFSTLLFAQVPKTGLIAFYPLDGNGHDSSGNGYNAKLNDSYTIKTGEYPDKGGNLCALYFGNWSLKAVFPLSAPYRSSISLWVKTQSNYTNFWGSNVFCTTQHDTLVLHSPTGAQICSLKIKDSSWNHLALTKPDSLSLGVYVNGNFQGTFSYTQPIMYGTFYSNPGSYALDDITVYDHTLSAFEIVSLYKANSSCSKVITNWEDVNYDQGVSIEFFPNPSSSGLFQLKAPEQYSIITIEDVFGRKIIPDKMGGGLIDLSQYPRGVYIASALSKGKFKKAKLLKE